MTLKPQWEQATIRGIGWSDKEELLVVAEDGTVRRYFGLDGDFTSFSLGSVTHPLAQLSELILTVTGCGRIWCESLSILGIWIRGIAVQQPADCGVKI